MCRCGPLLKLEAMGNSISRRAKPQSAEHQTLMASVSARLSPQHRSYVSRLLCHLERQGVSWSQVAPLDQVRPRQLEHIVTTAITQHGLDSNTRTAVNRAFRLLLQGPSGIVRLMPDNPAHQALMRCLPAPLSQQYRSCISRFLYYLEQQGTHWSQLAPPNAGDAAQLEQVVNTAITQKKLDAGTRAALNQAFGLGLKASARRG